MHMASAKAGRPKVNPGFAIVDLTGKVVTVRRTPAGQTEGDDVRAARLIYHTSDGRVALSRSETDPQVVISKLVNGQIDPKSTVTTQTLDYTADAAGNKVAVLTGAGHALMPMEAGGGKTDNAANASGQTERSDDGRRLEAAGRRCSSPARGRTSRRWNTSNCTATSTSDIRNLC